ncbi:hypothetical protein KIN20_006794 [Parelaphostrongylus tenuis]|uniref:Uncharacterized protein n=1 Tax=Parelaphostrongylus tenuis TaxID=148309 RepID=A0AAD5M6L4_PARTN|nr:hypothetical protein KIN20_006794 [Parelaphostrongylus tenuis]
MVVRLHRLDKYKLKVQYCVYAHNPFNHQSSWMGEVFTCASECSGWCAEFLNRKSYECLKLEIIS